MFNMSRDHMRNCCIVLFQFKAGGVIALTLQDSIVKAGLYLPVFQKNFIQLVQSILFTFMCVITHSGKRISRIAICVVHLLFSCTVVLHLLQYKNVGARDLEPLHPYM